MFQYEWFDRKEYITLPSEHRVFFHDLLCQYNVSGIRLSHWEEHCLECAPPLCYKSCVNYKKRTDRSCKNLSWGMKEVNNVENGLFTADVKFRKWGKIETHIFPAVVTLESCMRWNHINKIITEIISLCSNLIHFISPYKRLNGAWTLFRKIFFRFYGIKTNKPTNVFLCQFYSFENYEFSLCVDMVQVKKGQLVYRNKITVKPGENIHKLDVPVLGDHFRIYPENNLEVRLLFNFCELVQLMDSKSKIKPAEKLKCIVWDLDHTVWDGILIESNENNLSLKPQIKETIIALDKMGILQSISSKNDEKNAIRVLERLGISEYFLYPMINWGAKSSNIKRIAELLNIDVNTFGFIDDSRYEREEVANNLPQVRVYDDSIVTQLLGLSELNIEITKDAAQRRKMYQAEAHRRKVQSNFQGDKDSNLAFLKSCEIEFQIFVPTGQEDVKRSYDLLLRTNQLNLSAQKYSFETFTIMMNNGENQPFAVIAKDKYGDYGQVAFLLCKAEAENLIINEFAMSCRVAGKFIESAIVKWLQDKYSQYKKVILEGVQTQKNILLINNFKGIGFKDMSSCGNIRLSIPIEQRPNNYDIVRCTNL